MDTTPYASAEPPPKRSGARPVHELPIAGRRRAVPASGVYNRAPQRYFPNQVRWERSHIRWTGTRPRTAPASRIRTHASARSVPEGTDIYVMILTIMGSAPDRTPRRLARTLRTKALFLVLVSLLATIPALAHVMSAGGPAEAHGTTKKPGSHTLLCWQHEQTDSQENKPVNPACKAAQQARGTTPFYNRFSVLRSDG